jgi:serine/threonine protein phosphatase PrpC
MFMEDTWGFFGVFDGHGGSQCSSFISRRINEELRHGPPDDDAATKELMLRLDKEFLDLKLVSGSTGTFVIVQEDTLEGKPAHRLRVGNIGDSRILLGRADGTMVEGLGTDGALTTDHKPDHPDERERIERTGGYVEDVMGVARVNGDLAVSRAFGDGQYKTTGGPAQEDHPVSACPEFSRCHCSSSDFIVLVCDGISESNFPNREVVELVAEELSACEVPDAGKAAEAVCRRALERGSMDNLSCMIVLLNGAEVKSPGTTLLPGPVSAETLTHSGWRKAYTAMSLHADLSLAETLEKRYDIILKEQAGEQELSDCDECKLKKELSTFGSQHPASLASGSPERIAWFSAWLQEHAVASEDGLSECNPDQGCRPVKIAPVDKARALIESHPSTEWDDRLLEVCGGQGVCLIENDSRAKVNFPEKRFSWWLPASAVGDVIARVAPLEELRGAVDAHPALAWKDRLEETCGKEVRLLKADDSDGTSQVQMLDESMTVWLPQSCLTSEDTTEDSSSEDAESAPAEYAEESPRKRPRSSRLECKDPEPKSPEESPLSAEVNHSLMAH